MFKGFDLDTVKMLMAIFVCPFPTFIFLNPPDNILMKDTDRSGTINFTGSLVTVSS